MAAGQGFKTFTTGEVLTAGDVNGYLMQGINVFASTAARDAAITAPAEGQFAFTKDTNGLWYYDGAAWVASGATGDIEGVTAGIGISGGGTSGTVTITNSMATAIDAKGDLVPGTGADTFSRLAVGANGTILTADSAEATGLKWAAAPSAGANWSLLSSTTLSGTTTTVTGISGKDKIMILIRGASSGTGYTEVNVRLNTDTGANYNYMGPSWNAPGTYSTNFLTNKGAGGVDTSIPIGAMGSGGGNVSGYCLLSGCNASGVKVYNAAGGGNSGGTGALANNMGGWYNSATVISSISVVAAGGGSFSGGTVLVYTSA